MMLSRTVRLARTRVVAACCVLIALSGCGPGVVGTGSGTDDDGSEDIQYLPIGLCTAPFAEIGLACSPDVSDPDRGTAPVRWADANKSNEGATALASLEAQGMRLDIPCAQVTYDGRWGKLPDGSIAFVGRYVSPNAPDGQPAIARVGAAPNEPDAVGWLQIEDASGSELFGPWLVRKVDGQVSFTACAP
jgi:hypothetical protein